MLETLVDALLKMVCMYVCNVTNVLVSMKQSKLLKELIITYDI